MEKLVRSKLDNLFQTIEESSYYKEYKEMAKILDKDKEIKSLIEEIRTLEQKATHLEYKGDNSYKEIDKEIKKKTDYLKNKPIYQEYLNKMELFNDELAISSKMISDYIKEKV